MHSDLIFWLASIFNLIETEWVHLQTISSFYCCFFSEGTKLPWCLFVWLITVCFIKFIICVCINKNNNNNNGKTTIWGGELFTELCILPQRVGFTSDFIWFRSVEAWSDQWICGDALVLSVFGIVIVNVFPQLIKIDWLAK